MNKKRISFLSTLLKDADTFADVGCDHGYLSKYMLDNGLCEKLYFSDIIGASLKKAECLLSDYVKKGVAIPVLCDGLKNIPSDVDEVLIAGMGGEEIVRILSDKTSGFIPKRFVFQPMHNAEKLRAYLIANGGYIERDFTFFVNGKYYDVLVGERSAKENGYTEAEIEFGKDNLRQKIPCFFERVEKLLKDAKGYVKTESLQAENKEKIEKKIKRLEGVLSGEIK